jgi:Dolichyl-phosphate-mannose-protein mannosyltransferase
MRKLKLGNLAVWLLFHVVVIRILLDNQDEAPAVVGRYNLFYALALALLAAVGLAGVVVLLRANPIRPPRWLGIVRRSMWFPSAVLAGAALLLLVVWLTPFQIFVTSLQKELLRGYATGAILVATYFLLFWCGRDGSAPWYAWLAVSAVVATGAIILMVHYLDRFPRLNTIDELHNWVVQWTYANTGLLGDALYRQMIPLPQPIYDSPHYILGLMLRFIGDSFWQARFARLLMACLALPFIYLSGRRMYGRRAGLLAVVVAVFLLAPTNYVRPDVFVGVMLSVAIYVYLRAQAARRPWQHYLTGLCVALAGEGHPLAYRFGLAFALLYLIRWAYQMWRTRRLFADGRVFALALGGFTGMLIYLSIHIIPGFEQGIHFARNYSPLSRTAAQQFGAALDIVVGQSEVWIGTSPVELLFVVLGVAVAVGEFEDGDRLLLALLVVSEALMIATYGYYREFYQVHFLPVFSLLAGRALANLTGLWDRRLSAGRLSSLTLAGLVFVASLGSLAQSAYSATNDPERAEFTAIARQLKVDLPRDAIVVGNENYFLKMRSLNYYGIQTITTDSWFLVKYQGYKLWEVTKPDIFILSSKIDLEKYTDLYSIYGYMNDKGFQLARCYTETGLINARVYVRTMPPGWEVDYTCRRYGDG